MPYNCTQGYDYRTIQRLLAFSDFSLLKLVKQSATLDHTSYCQAIIKPRPHNMPVLTRECLALKLRQNWLAKHPIDAPAPALDDSLTSLNWLQNLNIMKMAAPTPPASPTPLDQLICATPQYSPQTQVNPNAILNMGNVRVKQEPGLVIPPTALRLAGQFMDVAPPMATNPHAMHDKIDYKTNPYVKPPYSYATLICMAMKETKKNKITLAGIYNWITDNFMYYRHADPSWQNSIRHNLSLNKCFQKVPRRKDEPGKGGFWRINPEYEDMFINGIFKKRRATNSPITTLAPLAKRFRPDSIEDEEDSDSNSCSLPSTPVDNSPMLNSTSPLLNISKHQMPLTPQSSREFKQEPKETVFPLNSSHHEAPTLDFNWNSILLQDIDVGGYKVKTEDIIDCQEEDIASPITTLSPPPSDSNSEVSIDDLLNNAELAANEFQDPVDFESGQPLDLSISGMSLRPPEWWSDSLNETKGFFSPSHSTSGLHTPVVAQSPICDNEDSFVGHPWAEDKSELDRAIASFDTDITSLFDLDNIPSPGFGGES